jgi:phosphoenolpyruvate-protein kinase (PTS system EI component)
LVRQTCEAAGEAGIPTGVCGEAAGDPEMIPKLVALGVTELSMGAPAIPRVKKVVSEI